MNHSPSPAGLAQALPNLHYQLAWASDTHLDAYTAGGVVELGAAFAATSPADILLVTGDISSSPLLADHLVDLQKGWGGKMAFVLGNHDRWYASFEGVDDLVRRVCAETPGLIWLTEAAPIVLSPRCALVGIDGFYDCGWGEPLSSPIHMNDRGMIGEFNGLSRKRFVELLQKRGVAAAEAGARILRAALAQYDEVIFATHAPPWREACASAPERFPWYVARYLGEAIERVAAEHPTKKIRVLAGHVHTASEFAVAPNLSCTTADVHLTKPCIHSRLSVGYSSPETR